MEHWSSVISRKTIVLPLYFSWCEGKIKHKLITLKNPSSHNRFEWNDLTHQSYVPVRHHLVFLIGSNVGKSVGNLVTFSESVFQTAPCGAVLQTSQKTWSPVATLFPEDPSIARLTRVASAATISVQFKFFSTWERSRNKSHGSRTNSNTS